MKSTTGRRLRAINGWYEAPGCSTSPPASFAFRSSGDPGNIPAAMKPSRNDPCPCGSGKKYKRCHLAADQAEASARLAEDRTGRDRFVTSEGVSEEALAAAKEFFAARDRGDGPAQQMMRYVEPLLGGIPSEQDLNRAVQMGMTFWNLSLLPPGVREEATQKIEAESGLDAEGRTAFRQIAEMMIARHEAMFPELHKRPGGIEGEEADAAYRRGVADELTAEAEKLGLGY